MLAFLGIPHRHIFHFRVRIEVFHNDRDIEFIQFKRWMEKTYMQKKTIELDSQISCEMIADDLYEKITAKYPDALSTLKSPKTAKTAVHITLPTSY